MAAIISRFDTFTNEDLADNSVFKPGITMAGAMYLVINKYNGLIGVINRRTNENYLSALLLVWRGMAEFLVQTQTGWVRSGSVEQLCDGCHGYSLGSSVLSCSRNHWKAVKYCCGNGLVKTVTATGCSGNKYLAWTSPGNAGFLIVRMNEAVN